MLQIRYERKLRKTSTKEMSKSKKKVAQKADNKYNKHYYKVSCGSVELVIYDKVYQMVHEGLTDVAYDDYSFGVLRFECRLMRDRLRKIEKEQKCSTTKQLLKHLVSSSRELLVSAFSRCFAEDDFCRLDEIKNTIRASGYRKVTQDIMIELSNRLSRGKIVDKVFDRMEKDGIIALFFCPLSVQ